MCREQVSMEVGLVAIYPDMLKAAMTVDEFAGESE